MVVKKDAMVIMVFKPHTIKNLYVLEVKAILRIAYSSQNIFGRHTNTFPRPGLVSTVGDRPPTNLAIQVCFRSEIDEFFFGGGKFMRDTDQFELLSSANKRKAPSTGKSKSGLYTLSLYEKERTYKLALWNVSFKRWAHKP